MCKLIQSVLHNLLLLVGLLFLQVSVKSQTTTNNSLSVNVFITYKDTVNTAAIPAIKTKFIDLAQAYEYINALPNLLSNKGYVTASVDSVWQINNDVYIQLYIGTKYNLVQLKLIGIDKQLLAKTGYTEKTFEGKPLNFEAIEIFKEKLLVQYENAGFPFTAIYLDSVSISSDKLSAALVLNKGILYAIDSIKNYGSLKISPKFLQSYLGIKNGSIYNRDKLKDIDKRMLELPFAQTMFPSKLNMLGSGSIVNLFVNNKKSSQVSAILGFLPSSNNTGKFQLTGDVNIDLKNVFGAGEGLLFKYQALQPKSPRINFGFEKPYFLQSAFGLSFLFELFKKDSAFLQLNAQIGSQFSLGNNQTGKLVLQIQNNNLLFAGLDTNSIKAQRMLPQNIDVKSVNTGITYKLQQTNYIFNPIKGTELSVSALAGIKTIVKNNDILNLSTPGYSYASLYDSIKLKNYQIKLVLSAAHYFKLKKSSTLKAAIHTGIYSSPTIYRNEVFQIGGYKLLRGFDEESIYATQYAVATAEFRALLGLNSYFFSFIDAGATKATYQSVKANNFFTGAGLGIVYETKAGLLNFSIALGKRDDVPFTLRQASKIHFGYINYF